MNRHVTVLLTALTILCASGPTLRAQYGQNPGPQYNPQQPAPPMGNAPYAADQNGQDPNAADQNPDDPQRGVARISIVQGDVNLKRGDSGELVAAVMNAPMVAQDHLQTSPGSRAEIQLDYANMIRLGPNTDLSFSGLEYRRYQAQLGAGTILYRVLRDSNAQVEIDTPSIAVRATQRGEYRIAVLEDGTTQLTVRSGELEVFSQQGTQRLQQGRSMLVRSGQAGPEFQTTYEIPRDQLEDWSGTRDRELLASRSYEHVNADVYGADDLDANGSWVPSEYGPAWTPRVASADWVPYSDGRWSWEDYYGWTWIDNSSWGWAPYHYGRWFWNGGYNRWCWYPGAYSGPAYWRPALVGFFGIGGGFGVGVGFGGIGWVPLAPYERFHPWYGRGFYGGGFGGGYGRNNFNIIANANVYNTFRNSRFNGAVRMANYNNFGGVSQRFGVANRGQLTNASVFRGPMPVTPSRSSYQFSNRQAFANPRLSSAGNRQFFQHQQPAAAARFGSFGSTGSTGYRSVQQAQQQPGSHGVAPNLGSLGRAGYSQPAVGGWQRFGDPGSNTRQSSRTSEPSGWHSFGVPRETQPSSAYSGARSNGYAPQSGTVRSYSGSSYGRGYESRPLGLNQPMLGQRPQSNSFSSGGRSSYSAPSYSAPRAPSYSSPSYNQPRSYSQPQQRFSGGGGGGSYSGGSHSSGGSSSHGGGGSSHNSGGSHSSGSSSSSHRR